MGKTLFIKTLGCAMNEKDSENIKALLESEYIPTDDSSNADLIIINTCSIREKPVSKLFSELGTYNKHKKAKAKIGVCGCSASHLGQSIIKRAPYVDFVVGARNISSIPDAVKTNGFVKTDITNDDSELIVYAKSSNKYVRKINISLGCDMKCSYCIVPSTRGKEVSIPADIIINEAKKAVDDGVVEILLLGQNVNSYKKDGMNFTKLLQEVSKIKGIERIRFTSPHPTHMSDEFLEEFANNPKICKNIHIPLQSGSNTILKQMKRTYTREWFLDRCEKIRQIKDVRISTDIIVGFVGESDSDFEDTLDIVKKVEFEQVYNFIYSPRPNTTALDIGEAVDKQIATKRLNTLIELHKQIADKKMASYVGKSFSVLFDNLNDGILSGYSDNYVKVKVDMRDKNGFVSDEAISHLGKIKNVKITLAQRTGVLGELV